MPTIKPPDAVSLPLLSSIFSYSRAQMLAMKLILDSGRGFPRYEMCTNISVASHYIYRWNAELLRLYLLELVKNKASLMDATAMEGSRVVGCGHSFTSEREPARTKQTKLRHRTVPHLSLCRNTIPSTNYGFASSKRTLSTPRDTPFLPAKQTPATSCRPPTMAPKQLWTASHP
jgi:hypothetical protein